MTTEKITMSSKELIKQIIKEHEEGPKRKGIEKSLKTRKINRAKKLEMGDYNTPAQRKQKKFKQTEKNYKCYEFPFWFFRVVGFNIKTAIVLKRLLEKEEIFRSNEVGSWHPIESFEWDPPSFEESSTDLERNFGLTQYEQRVSLNFLKKQKIISVEIKKIKTKSFSDSKGRYHPSRMISKRIVTLLKNYNELYESLNSIDDNDFEYVFKYENTYVNALATTIYNFVQRYKVCDKIVKQFFKTTDYIYKKTTTYLKKLFGKSIFEKLRADIREVLDHWSVKNTPVPKQIRKIKKSLKNIADKKEASYIFKVIFKKWYEKFKNDDYEIPWWEEDKSYS